MQITNPYVWARPQPQSHHEKRKNLNGEKHVLQNCLSFTIIYWHEKLSRKSTEVLNFRNFTQYIWISGCRLRNYNLIFRISHVLSFDSIDTWHDFSKRNNFITIIVHRSFLILWINTKSAQEWKRMKENLGEGTCLRWRYTIRPRSQYFTFRSPVVICCFENQLWKFVIYLDLIYEYLRNWQHFYFLFPPNPIVPSHVTVLSSSLNYLFFYHQISGTLTAQQYFPNIHSSSCTVRFRD